MTPFFLEGSLDGAYLSKYERIKLEYSTGLTYLQLRWIGVSVGKGARFLGMPIVTRHPDSEIKLGNQVLLTSKSVGTALGVRSRVILRTLAAGARLIVGDDTGMSGTVICAAISIEIGQRCLIGADCMIFDTDFHNYEPVGRRHSPAKWAEISKPVRIEDDVFLGARVIVCKGVNVGCGSIVAAGSVVTSNIPSMSIAAGSPAKVIKTLSSSV